LNQDILNKIQKLLALSNSPNENEALCAAQKASELMLKHHISRADVTDNGGAKKIVIESMAFEYSDGKNKNKFNGALATTVAKFFNCYVFWYGPNLQLIGRREDLDTVFYLYKAFKNQIGELADFLWEKESVTSKEHGKTWKHSFRFGMLTKLTERLNQQKAETVRTSSKTSLVVFNEVEIKVKDFVANLTLKKGIGSQIRSGSAYQLGYLTGDNLNLNFKNDDRISQTMRIGAK